jgi:hypothetical protein
MVIIGMGAYELLYWIPYLLGPDSDGDWNYTRRAFSFFIGFFLGDTVHSQLCLQAKGNYISSLDKS